MDQQLINELVEEGIQAGLDSALLVYEKGGHSKTVATLTLPDGLGASLNQDAKVVGVSSTGEQIVLAATDDYESTATSVQLVYVTPNCYIGGLPEAEQVSTGCK